MNTFLFYDPAISAETKGYTLSAEESWHIVKVLRYKEGDTLLVTNGRGSIFKTEMIFDSPKGVELEILNTRFIEPSKPEISLAISPVKNRETMEWLVEKSTEIGVTQFHFFTSEHSERTILNLDRLEKIAISAIKQSLQSYKPKLNPLLTFKSLLNQFQNKPIQKFIAHCEQSQKQHISKIYHRGADVLMMIGPEGGFSEKEVELGKCMNFDIVSLGENRLRTETASIYALSVIHSMNIHK
jgi:16S rRNA (uracil1498-N3)-methyltransferase